MLSILGLFAIIFISVLTFRTARDYGRNVVLWTFAALAVGLGIQIIVPAIIVLIAVVTGNLQPNSPSDDPSWLAYITIGCFIGGIIGSFLVLRQVSKMPDDENFDPPPPPTTFDL